MWNFKNEFTTWNIAGIVIIIAAFAIFLNLYSDFQISDDSDVIIFQNFPSNKFFDAEIEIKNLSHKKHVVANDLLTYSITIKPKRDDVMEFLTRTDVLHGDDPIKNLEISNFSFDELGTTRAFKFPMHLNDLGENFVRTTISLSESEIPEEMIHRDEDGTMIGISGKTDWTLMHSIDVKSAIEVIQIENLEIQRFGMAVTGSIGTITALALLANVFISHRQSAFLKEQNKTSKKHAEYLGILEIMKIFNNDENGQRRDEVYSAYNINHLYDANDYIFEKTMRNNVAAVRGNYEMMGSLVKEGYVQKQKFLEMYVESVINMYKVLRPHINYERKRRKSKNFASNFEWIFEEAKKYWKENFPSITEPDPSRDNS